MVPGGWTGGIALWLLAGCGDGPLFGRPTPDPEPWGTGSLAAPDALIGESGVCWTLGGGDQGLQLLAMGMDTGRTEVLRFDAPVDPRFDLAGLGFDGDSLLAFAANEGQGLDWHTLDLEAGVLAQGATTTQSSVTWTEDGWLTAGTMGTWRFVDTEALMANRTTPAALEIPGTRLQALGDIVYSAPFRTDSLDRTDVGTGLDLGPVRLDGFEDRVAGIGVTRTNLYVIDEGDADGLVHIHRFELDGSRRESFALDGQQLAFSGLWCHAPP